MSENKRERRLKRQKNLGSLKLQTLNTPFLFLETQTQTNIYIYIYMPVCFVFSHSILGGCVAGRSPVSRQIRRWWWVHVITEIDPHRYCGKSVVGWTTCLTWIVRCCGGEIFETKRKENTTVASLYFFFFFFFLTVKKVCKL